MMWIALGLALGACGKDEQQTADDSDGDLSNGGTSGGSGATGEPPAGTTDAPTTAPEPGTTTSGAPPTDTGDDTTTGGGELGECDPKAQDCDAGYKCTAVSKEEGKPWNANVCVPVMGEGVAGDSCDVMDGKYSGHDDCAKGLICMLTDPEGQDGVCIELCTPDDECTMTSAQCEEYNDGVLPICLPACDPLIQDCGEGQACYQGGANTFVCFKEVAEPGQGGQGSTCMSVNICQKGYHCADAATQPDCAGAGCCTAFCPLSEGDANCPVDTMCLPFFAEGEAPEAYADVGICAIMQ
jgi:hypothetical protein